MAVDVSNLYIIQSILATNRIETSCVVTMKITGKPMARSQSRGNDE